MSTYTTWIVLLCVLSVAERGRATPRNTFATTRVRPKRGLRGVDCQDPEDACLYARGQVAPFMSYLATTTDDPCTCTCPVNGDTLAHEAAESSNVQSLIVLERLSSSGCDLDIKNDNNDTPLHDACGPCNVAQAAYLVQTCSDVLSINNDGWSPLCLCINNCPPSADALIQRMIDKLTGGKKLNTCIMCKGGKSVTALAKDPKIKEIVSKGLSC